MFGNIFHSIQINRIPESSIKLRALAFALVLSLANSYGQVAPILGLEPPSTKWNTIKTPLAEIIYEPRAKLRAFRTADIISRLSRLDSLSIGGPAQPVPIILHSQSTLSAGVPFLGPWKSDWTLSAPEVPFMGTLRWIDGLTVHEYRHHQQMTRAKKGWFSGFLRGVLGQTGWFIGVLTIQPTWFFEGDATYTETVLTNGGRGRQPLFDREYRALRLSGLNYNYEKATRRNRKDFVPNIYRAGYYMTIYARNQYGRDVWTKVLEDTYRKKGFFYPFNRALKSTTGLTTPQLYEQTMLELDSIWTARAEELNLIKSKNISNTSKKYYTDYRFPYSLGNGNLLVEKSSFQEIRTLYRIDQDGNETKIISPGNVSFDHFNISYSGGKAYWAENRYHPRWDLKDYSVVFSYDLESGKKKQLTRKTRFYSPTASEDGSRLAVLQLNEDGTQEIVVLNPDDESIIASFSGGDWGQFYYPRINSEGTHLVTSFTNEQGNTIRRYDLETGSFEDLIPFSDFASTSPFEVGGKIYYSASNTGIDNIYVVDISSKRVYQATSTLFGAYDPNVSADGRHLYFSEYTALGFDIKQIPIDESNWINLEPETTSSISYFSKAAEEEGGSVLTSIVEGDYQPQKFNSSTRGLLNFHSWTPSIDENEYGLEVLSNNIMSNTAATISYRYNVKESSNVFSGKLSYGALFPVFDLGYSYNLRGSKMIYDDTYSGDSYEWRESKLFGGIRFPFRLSSGTYNSGMSFGAQFDRYKILEDSVTEVISQNESFNAIEAQFSFRRTQSQRPQLLNPRWGQILQIDYARSLEEIDEAEMFTGSGTLFFPGAYRTHSIFITGSFQNQNVVNAYRFEDTNLNSRGFRDRYWSDENASDFENLYTVGINYQLPIAFTDWDLGSIAYIQSIAANPFYEYSQGELGNQTTLMRAAGVDWKMEFTALRLLRSGLTIRTLYRFDTPDPEMNPFVFDVIFVVNDLAF